MVETDPRFAPLLERLDTLESTDSSKAITQNDELHGRIHAEFGAKRPAIEESIKEYLMIYNNKRRAIIGEVNAYCEYLQGCYADMVRNYRFIGERFSKSLVLDTNFTFGIKKDWIEEKLNIGTGNLIIRPSTDNSKMERFLQTLIINAFSNVMPGKCSIEVYDPNNMAKSVMPLFTQELSEYLTSNYSDLNKSLSDLREYAQQNLKLMAGRTISEYNTIAEREGITPIQYKILLILSQPKTVEETEEINKFFDYSADTGVLLWIISQDMTSPNATIIRKPFDGIQYPIFDYSNPNWEELCLAVTARPEKAKPSKGGLTAEEVEEKFIADFQKGVEKLVGLGKEEISDRMCRKISENVVNAISKAKPAGLPWVEFIENVIPDSMMWKATADNFMNLYPGYENGDPNKYKPYEIGNTGNVHVLGVGGTGAGKSVFLNHLIATISQEYSPKEVELWLCDFKGTEFKFYLPRAETNWKMLPHIKACLCTSDGDYATSLFKALRDEADLRYEILKTPEMYRHLIPYIKTDADVPSGFKGTKDWNVYWRRKAAETGDDGYLKNIFPRILFICDEFQVIFEKAEPNNLEKIKADITQIAKVGRAANVHIFFTSQSMNKTLSPDILQQFTLRFALRCDKEVSMQILGTNKAGEIKERFGFLYVSATGIEKEKQPKYKTPYFRNDDEQFRQIIKCAERAEAEGIPPKDIITYEEATKHPIKEMTDLYKKPEFQKVIPDSGVFLLGNRMAYSSNKAPDNIILPAQNDTNILSCFSDYTDFAMFFNQIVTNINCNRNPGQLMINSQVTELSDLVLPEKYITDKPVFTSRMTPKTTPKEFLEAVEKIYLNRKEKKVTDSPLWIICLGWEKGKGIGIEKDAMLSVKFQTLIKTIGEFNMHFILINSSMAGFPVTVAELFKYRIAGKCTTEDSIALIKTKQAGLNYDLKTGWLFSHHDGVTTRDKLYISEVEGKVEQLEIVL